LKIRSTVTRYEFIMMRDWQRCCCAFRYDAKTATLC